MPGSQQPHPLIQHYARAVPHTHAMGQELVEVERGRILMRQPWGEHLLGDAARGLIHTSVQLSLVDSGFGAVVIQAVKGREAIATMDLRMDYQRPAVAGSDLWLEAWVDQISRQVVFVSGKIWQLDKEKPTSLARAAFMRASSSKPAYTSAER